MTPISSLDYDIKDAIGEKYKIELIACKKVSRKKYDCIIYNRLDINTLSDDIKAKFDSSLKENQKVPVAV